MNNQIIFREVAGVWRRVDSQEPKPQTLADFLKEINVVIDDDTQFCRIIRYYGKIKTTIEYRAYNGSTVRISVHAHEIQ